ncbi:MAG TPA: metal ABC transporter ATP-binding protein [Geobacteraceae bacterium]|nr:metal ABC transporter ATP-binding protein [Geobacteraceae bacterium]
MMDISTSSAPAIELEGVRVSYNGVNVLENISLTVEPGSFVGIIGPNGAGKTTLLKVILGLQPLAAGEVRLFGLKPSAVLKKKKYVGYVPQKSLLDRDLPFSVMDVILMGRVGSIGPLKWFGKKDLAEAENNLRRVELLDYADRPIGELSGGQMQRVLIARALSCGNPRILILDEPTVGVDIPHQLDFYELLAKLQKEMGLTILVVTHEVAIISKYADRMVCLNRTMHLHCNPAELMHYHGHEEMSRCEFEQLFGTGEGQSDAG